MAKSQLIRPTLVAIIAVAVFVVAGGLGWSPVQAQPCPGLDPGGLKRMCVRYVLKPGPKMAPSAACCAGLRNVNILCACKYVNKDVEKAVSVEKAVYVAKYCGIALPHGSKCGSFTFP